MKSVLSWVLPLRLCAALLLAVIGVQAAEPVRAPLNPAPGSAFSAATIDVALMPARTGSARALVALPEPVEPPRPVTPLARRSEGELASRPWPCPRSCGPPPRSHPAFPPDSTAPPLA